MDEDYRDTHARRSLSLASNHPPRSADGGSWPDDGARRNADGERPRGDGRQRTARAYAARPQDDRVTGSPRAATQHPTTRRDATRHAPARHPGTQRRTGQSSGYTASARGARTTRGAAADIRGTSRTGAGLYRSPRTERLPAIPPRLVVAVLALIVLLGAALVACDAMQRSAAEAAQREKQEQERKLHESQRVDAATLGATAAPLSTPKSAWRQGETPHLYQIDPVWSEQPYAGDTVRTNGCGPTSLAMVYARLTGKTDLDPARMAAFADSYNFAPTGATEWAFMTVGASMLGLGSYTLPVTRDSITQALESGQPVICSVVPGDFTTTGHYIVLDNIDERGMVQVFDPNSALNSARRWGIQRIIEQTANCWTFWA